MDMRTKRLFLSLLTIIALTFPGMSVCATELQTDETESGETEVAQATVKFFEENDIFYYKSNDVAIQDTVPDDSYGKDEYLSPEDLLLMQALDELQAQKEQTRLLQQRQKTLGISITLLLIVLSFDIGYHAYGAVLNHRARHKTTKAEEPGVTLEATKAGNG